MRFDAIDAVLLSPSEIVAALDAGTIDAGCLYPPFSDQVTGASATGSSSWPVQMMQDYYFLVLAREGFLPPGSRRSSNPCCAGCSKRKTYLRKKSGGCEPPGGTGPQLTPARVGRTPRQGSSRRFSLNEDLLTLMETTRRGGSVAQGIGKADDLPNCFALVHYGPLELLKPEAVGRHPLRRP